MTSGGLGPRRAGRDGRAAAGGGLVRHPRSVPAFRQRRTLGHLPDGARRPRRLGKDSRTRGSVLGADFRIAVYPGGAPLIHDAANARIVETVLGRSDPSWHPTSEAPVPGMGRRSTDIRLDRRGETVLMEVETHVRALEAIIRESAGKRAAVADMAPATRRIHIVLVLPPSRHHRALVKAHPGFVAAAFPANHAELSRALASHDVEWPGDGILWATDRSDRTRAGRA